jgi:parallel beta-helix repeat protein
MWLSTDPALAQGCGAMIKQDTTLNSDLVNCPANGLVIDAPNIILDLNGHTIDGDVNTALTGIDNTAGHDEVKIKNGTIREFTDGISLTAADRNQLSELEVSYNDNGILLDQSNTNTIEESSASDNVINGISLTNSNNNIIEESSASDNNNDGISLTSSNTNIIEENSTSDNVNDGILFNDSDDNRVRDNSLFDNENFGIAIENGSDLNRIRNNEASNNGHPNGMAGIFVDTTSTRTLIEDNFVEWNKVDGIFVNTDPLLLTGTTVKDNTANSNGQWGITVQAPNTDGGGNKATGNGQAGQCFNVAC